MSMNPFAGRISSSSPVWSLSAVMLVSGFLLSLAYVTNQAHAATRAASEGTSTAQPDPKINQELVDLREEVKKLRLENTKLQNSVAAETGQAKVLNESLQELKVFSGLTDVTGPGITITLRDIKGNSDLPIEETIIHDLDVLKVVNELWNAGAEGVAVNGNRITVSSSVRCVGTTVLIDTVRVASPYNIQAIGDAKSLYGALTFPGGIFDQYKIIDKRMIEIAQVDKMFLPPYGGSTKRKYLRPVEDKEKS